MYAIEFEADIRNGTVKLPEKYRLLDSAHVRVVLTVNDERLMGEPEVELDFSNTEIKAFSGRDALELQRTMRDKW
ncbi:hypothetical protein SAMN04488490_0039 [Marinobacter sp. LV10R510-11A]|jgi:hypothetical protein|uniref:hypothetical protein n=1 Tax=Marinobacter sp. LV10R510-11A TaxID=1415568 RepID=UPI000BB82513|nr:hypothetical protein [Marinobacter sp. LV10R510-11A]SOB74557.1 hypothetical protein SAMN04488490_0039 [Marinobacter sp. LV10R510-11A]